MINMITGTSYNENESAILEIQDKKICEQYLNKCINDTFISSKPRKCNTKFIKF